MGNNAVYPKYKAWKANGTSPASGYHLFTYESGTDIDKPTYSDAELTTQNANPIVLNSVGEANIFLESGEYRFDLYSPAGALINTFDPISTDGGGGEGAAIAVVDSIAELRLLPASTQFVQVLGYYSPGDKGGDFFYYDSESTAADNGGTIIQATAAPATGRYIRAYNGIPRLRMFGWAGGDSGGDAAAEAAFELYTEAIQYGGKFVIPGYLRINNSDLSPGKLELNGIGNENYGARIEFQFNGTKISSIYVDSSIGELTLDSDSGDINFLVENVERANIGTTEMNVLVNLNVSEDTDLFGTLLARGMSELRGGVMLGNTASAFLTTLDQPAMYSTSGTGSAPFNEVGHLIIQPAVGALLRDIIFATDGGNISARIFGDGTARFYGETTVEGPLNTANLVSSGTITVADGIGTGGIGAFAINNNKFTIDFATGNTVIAGTVLLAADPVSNFQAATKQYVDAIASGIKGKAACACATTANITLSGEQTIDGVLTSGSRVCVKDQSTASQNGIYVSAAGAWSRATDMDADAEAPGALTFISGGTVNANTQYYVSTPSPITLGSTSITWILFYQAGEYVAGAGLTKTGNTFDVVTASSSRIVVNTDTIDLASGIVTPGSYPMVTVDTYGRVTAGSSVVTATNGTYSGTLGVAGATTLTSASANQMVFAGGTTVNTRMRMMRGSDDATNYLQMGWDRIEVVRSGEPLASPQLALSFNQVGSDGTRTPLAINTDGSVSIAGASTVGGTLGVTGAITGANNVVSTGGHFHASSGGGGYWMTAPGTFTYGMHLDAGALKFRSGSTSDWLTVTSAGLPTVANAATFSSTLGVAGTTTYSGSAGVAFNAGSNGYYYAQKTANNQIALNSAGDYGFISNTAANTWALGYGTTPTTLGTSALTWNTSGVVTIPGLAGTGTRLVTATSTGALGNGTTLSGSYSWTDPQTYTTTVTFSSGVTFGADNIIQRAVGTALVNISGGNASNSGSNIQLYGADHATKAYRFELRNGNSVLLEYRPNDGIITTSRIRADGGINVLGGKFIVPIHATAPEGALEVPQGAIYYNSTDEHFYGADNSANWHQFVFSDDLT